jgi:tetratricopeptide (TPR) repeat protein
MTVRWKPLLILSGLFLVIAVVGVIAFVYTLVPRGSADILPLARASRAAGKFENADIQFQQALKVDGKNAAIHEEYAGLFAEWAERAPAEKKGQLRLAYVRELEQAARYNQKLKGPRRLLLKEAMRRDEAPAAVHWAKDLVGLDPKDAEAHYVLASEGLNERTPNVPEVRRHLKALEAAGAPAVRTDWVKARVADLTADDSARDEVLTRSRTVSLPDGADPVDRMALISLRALDVVHGEETKPVSGPSQAPPDPAVLSTRIQALRTEVRAMVASPALAPARIIRLGALLERIQRSLIQLAAGAESKTKGAVAALVDAIEGDVETLYQKALDAANKPELSLFLTYADHLRYREKRAECLEVVGRALRTPAASKAASADIVMGLHAIATESALANLKDSQRIEKASPHIKAMLASTNPRYQGLGHLFQGAIDLELAGVTAGDLDRPAGELASKGGVQPKLRASALTHLKAAAAQLPDIAEAQARYGVALVLSQEQGLGRQYLQNALRMGTLAPQYQIWAAWSMVQAGYPEEAQPIVEQLLNEVQQGRQPAELEGTLHLLAAEIHQSRRSPAELKRALDEYLKAHAAGQPASPAVQLRLAQIDVQLGRRERALTRIEQLRKVGQGVPAVEHLAVLILQDQGKKAEARKTLEAARAKYPDSDELIGVDAALLARDGKPKDADRLLAGFLKKRPDEVGIALMRAQILADLLDDPKAARKVLLDAADRGVNSAPLVQLALLDLRRHDHDAVAATIAKVRARWKEAATADLLDAQLALDEGNVSAAVGHFDEALRKDPGNKLVQYWKAQLDIRTGAATEAARVFEELVRDQTVKELDSGVSLMSAAQSALASLALQSGEYDAAIGRLEELRDKSESGVLDRPGRWQLATAFAAKGEWDRARSQVAALLDDANEPPTDDERVRGANFYRLHQEDAAAVAQLDRVLKHNPTHPGAVVIRAYMLAGAKQAPEAAALLRKAIDGTPKKDKPPAVFFLMLAAVENALPPPADASRRALAALDRGLGVQPNSPELVQAKYRVLALTGEPREAVAFVEQKAKGGPKGLFRRMLAEVYREQKDYAAAEKVVRQVMTDFPKDSALAASLVQLVASQAVEAANRGDRALERSLNEKTAGLIRDFRAKFPNDLSFLQAECDLAARRGDLTRATAVTQEMDKIAKSSPSGPLNRARLYAAQKRTREAADAFQEALERNPRQLDVRILLGQTRLQLGEADEALRQAKLVLETDRDRPEAVLLEAQALAGSGGSAKSAAAGRDEAIKLLGDVLTRHTKFTSGYHQLAEFQRAAGRKAGAVATLKKGLKDVPDDAAGLSQLVELLAGPRADGGKPSPPELEQAKAVATEIAGQDRRGGLNLAVAVGFHKAGALDLALPWAEKAAKQSEDPIIHLNFGDLLLSLAEAARNPTLATSYFRRAVEQYDLVLKAQANSVEAVNNKAWILHTHLGETDKALALALGLLGRVDPSTLPPEFFDTLGAIQQAKGKARDAEETYSKGLSKAPDHPVLNYHMGKLLAGDRGRAGKANGYLKKALAGRDRLSPSMAADVASLVKD